MVKLNQVAGVQEWHWQALFLAKQSTLAQEKDKHNETLMLYCCKTKKKKINRDISKLDEMKISINTNEKDKQKENQSSFSFYPWTKL